MTPVTRRSMIGWAAAAVLVLALAPAVPMLLAGDRPGNGAEKPKPQTHPVDIGGKGFSPSKITIRPGDSVTWANNDSRDHTVTASGGGFSSGNIKPGGSFSFRFNKPGTYNYSCSLHPRMKGTILVK